MGEVVAALHQRWEDGKVLILDELWQIVEEVVDQLDGLGVSAGPVGNIAHLVIPGVQSSVGFDAAGPKVAVVLGEEAPMSLLKGPFRVNAEEAENFLVSVEFSGGVEVWEYWVSGRREQLWRFWRRCCASDVFS